MLAKAIRVPYMSGMANTPDIIETLGGATAVSREIGVPVTTVHGWKRAGYVPTWRVPALVRLAKKLKQPITAADFPAKPAARKSSDQAVAA